jgi:hypothetical protein
MMDKVAEPATASRHSWLGLSPRAFALLAAIVVLGAVVRFWNLNWDRGTYDLHPDERTLNEMVRRLGPDLNPHFYYYGSLPIYLYRGSAEALSALTGVDWLSQARLLLVGRFWSALASTATLLVVFAIGRRLWGVRGGLLAAALMASAALAIQAAHFSTVESLITLAVSIILWLSLRILDGGERRWYVLAGVVLGLAMATKLTSGSFIVMPLLGHFLRGTGVRSQESGDDVVRSPKSKVRSRRANLAIFFGCALVAVLVAEPYYVLGWNDFWAAIELQADELAGATRFSYVWQFIGTRPYLFELRNLVMWGLGLPLGLAALAGWGAAIAVCGVEIANWLKSQLRRGNIPPTSGTQAASSWPSANSGRLAVARIPHSAFVLALWPTLYFLYVGTWQARFIRHLMPLVLFCCLFAAGLLVWFVAGEKWAGRGGWRRWAGLGVARVVLVGAVVWGLSLTSVYTTLDTRVAATDWFRENVPLGTRVVMEANYRPLMPIPDAAHPPETYQYNTLKVTDPDTPQKMADFAAALASGEVLIIRDRRWSALLPRLAGFELTGRYYRLLFDGELGYTPLITFANPPRLGPLVWWDDDAEETFQVFDHPTVRIFRNTGRLPEEELMSLLGAGR